MKQSIIWNFFEEYSKINVKMIVRGKQTINNAEIQVVQHAQLIVPLWQMLVCG